ncbi:glycosyltransferase (plasmid) [Mesorhizobium sp. AR02]|uniref:glycosyltransferase n=1 Tax=Mesorhizobium sp. AR02 TaxID=2865837 RepID=UPI00215EE647|nr:glycosyltransferase [Mesorhizobium sp. AR02]UVK57538.1 glycosyltransferase [Mesorhizobium sp. AR02]
MRIAIFSDNFHPELGGIQDSIEALAKALGQRGHAVDFYVPHYGRREFERINAMPVELNLGPHIRVHRLHSVPFPSSTKQSRAVFPTPASWLHLPMAARPDVIHTQTFFGAGLNALLAGRRLGVPVAGTNHTAIKAFGSYLPFGMDAAAAYVLWYYNHCDFVTAPSLSVFNELGQDRLRRPLEVVSNPIATDIFRPVSPAMKRKLRTALRLHGPTIVYAGRLGSEKNIDPILHALALLKQRVPSAELVIAGHGSQERHLRALVQRLCLEPSVRFVGTLTKSNLAELFQASDVFVTMSTSETQGMALLQAMACGIPVIGANARALPEFIANDRGFLVEASDVASLADRLADLFGHSHVRSRLGRGGASYVKQFATERIADQWEHHYQLLIERKTSDERSHQDQLCRASV